MSMQASEIVTYYVPLTPDGEWVMAAKEWEGRPGQYRWRLVRMGMVLIDAGFRLKAGETIQSRLALAVEEFGHSRGNFEALFHSNNRQMGVRMPPVQKRGTTPFNCPFYEFKALCAQWLNRVPARLRRRDFKVFCPWDEADKALLVSV